MTVVLILLSFGYLVDMDKLVRRIERLEERDGEREGKDGVNSL